MLKDNDPKISNLIRKEVDRQNEGLEMIPSENHTSGDVLEALGSRLTDKYSEGYPGMRYYGGCENIDQIENITRDRAKELFGCSHANVQPLSGSPANMAAYFALADPGDTIMGLKLYHGGHMTHGLSVNFSSIFYNSVQYSVKKDGYIDIDQMDELALKHKPKIIVVGATAYPRKYEWEKYKEIADKHDSFLMADISHIAGLIAGGVHSSPIGIADIVTTTTHKTLRGPRGAMILANGKPSNPLKQVKVSKENIPTLIDRAVIPGLQGGPHNHQTAAIAVALKEAMQPDFQEYAAQVVKNAKVLAEELLKLDFKLITNGTDNHLLLIDLGNKKVTGTQAEKALGDAGITVNKNTIPYDPRKPYDPSGIRLGTPAITTRGMKENEMMQIAAWIDLVINNYNKEKKLLAIKKEIEELSQKFPIKN